MEQEDAGRQVDAFVGRSREELVALCARLVAAGSVNPPGHTTAPAAVVQDFLAVRGLRCETLAQVAEKPNLVAATEGRGPGRHLVLNGHLDTIPPGEESEWGVPIHTLTRHDGRLHGLGMGNMKGAVAAMCLAYAFLAGNRGLWPGRLTLTAVADETVFGPDGAQFLLEARPDLVGDGLICGEGPGSMELAIAEKGVLWVEVEARVPSGQGMLMRRGASATARLAAVLGAIDDLNDERARPPAPVACLAASAGENGLRVSANIGIIEGGDFVSQVAPRAAARVDFRVPPGLSTAEVEGRLSRLVTRHPGMAWRRIKGWEPNWSAPDAGVARAVADSAAAVRGARPRPVVRLPASDASRWRALGTPAVCYGPQPTLVAGVDDYANEEDVVDGAKVYARAALQFLNERS